VDEAGDEGAAAVRAARSTEPPAHRASGSDAVPSELTADETAVDALLKASHLVAPHQLPRLVTEHSAYLGAEEAVVFLVDLQQRVLVPFIGPGGPGTTESVDALPVDSTLAGRAYQHVEVLTQPLEGGAVRVWLPLLDGTQRLGVLAVTLPGSAPGPDDERVRARLRRFASLIAELIIAKNFYGDSIVRTRRRGEMGLAAEIQWGLLPPQTFACDQLVVAAALEPAYEVAGDSVDYAVESDHAWFAVFDGMGHGLQSAQLATVSVAAYRNARRAGRSLTGAAVAIEQGVFSAFGGEAFTTAVLAELDTDAGVLSWINVGHLEPLLLRHNHLVKQLSSEPNLPFGLGLSPARTFSIGSEHLQRGDAVLLYTDGVVEARSPSGELFGLERLVDLVTRNLAAELPPNETIRRTVRELLAHQQAQLRDDATLLLVHWSGETSPRLLP
jgi:serine/threonine protein phosphatase PrpC